MTVVLHPHVVAQFATGSVGVGEFLTQTEDTKERVMVSALAFAAWRPTMETDALSLVQMGRLRILMNRDNVSIVPVTFDEAAVRAMVDHPLRWGVAASLPEVHTVAIVNGLEFGCLYVTPVLSRLGPIGADHVVRLGQQMRPQTRVLMLSDPPPPEPPAPGGDD